MFMYAHLWCTFADLSNYSRFVLIFKLERRCTSLVPRKMRMQLEWQFERQRKCHASSHNGLRRGKICQRPSGIKTAFDVLVLYAAVVFHLVSHGRVLQKRLHAPQSFRFKKTWTLKAWNFSFKLSTFISNRSRNVSGWKSSECKLKNAN